MAGNRFFAFSSLGRVPGGSRTDSGGSGGPPGSDFFQEFYDTFLLVFAILFCGLRADFVGVCQVCDAFLQVACRSCQGMSGLGRKFLYTTTTKKNIMHQKCHYEKEQLNIS